MLLQITKFHLFLWRSNISLGVPRWLRGKESACSAGGAGSIPGSGRFPGGKHGNPRQYSWMENSMDRGAWWATVHGVAKSWTQLKWLSMHCAIFHWCSYHIFLIHSSINGHLCWEAWFLIQMLLKNYWKLKAIQWQKKKKFFYENFEWHR